MTTSIDEILNITGGERTLIGGDLNTARLAREVWPGWGHGQFWDWIDSGEALVDSYRLFHETEQQTFFRDGSVHAFQDDHILVTPDLAPEVVSSMALDTPETHRVSDHIPVVTVLSVGAAE